ncbi:MAG: hypothetical protein JNG85_02780 [Spirochaetaceae bacterium]|nr:hypothetical protein [Spirochaetaceae bacterium]
MNAALLSGKIRVPAPPRTLVPRPGLRRILEEGLARPVVLVSAPAGFGKTSLAAEYLACLREGERGREGGTALRAAWLSLDPEDDDPVRFWASVAASLDRAEAEAGGGPGAGETPFRYLSEAASSLQPPSIAELSSSILQAAERSGRRFLLVLDDFHLLSSPAVLDSFARFAERLPESFRLLILSRSDPRLPLARFRARGKLADLRADELRFSDEEAERFLNASLGSGLSSEQAAAIDRKAEGWAAGLQMAALSLARRGDPEAFIRGFSGSDRFVLEFLVEEVLAAQPPELRDFLFASALLDRFCPSLLDEAIHPEGGSEEMLRRLDAANLFLVPLDDEGTWYRYHHLFSETLRARRKTLSLPGERGILLAAAGWHEARKESETAVGLLLRLGEIRRAADLLDTIAYPLLSRGERFTLEALLGRIGREEVLRHPELAQIAAWTLVFAGKAEETDAFLDGLEAATAEMVEGKDKRDLRGAAAVMRAFAALQRGRLATAEAKAGEAEALLGEDRPFARNMVPFVLGSCLRARARLPEAMVQVERFVGQALAWGDVWNMMMAFYEGSLTARCRGRLALAEDYYRRSLAELSRRGIGNFGSSCKVHGNYAELLYERNELERIEELLRRYADGGEDWVLPTDILVALSPLVKARIATGDLSGADELLERAARIEAKTGIFPRIKVLFRDLRIRRSIAAGAPVAPAAPDYPPELVAEAQSVEASDLRLLCALGRFPEAAERAGRLAAAAMAGGGLSLFIEAKAVEAVARSGAGQAAGAGKALAEALRAALGEAFVRTFVDLGEGMRRLLADLRASGGEEGEGADLRAYAARLLSAFPAGERRGRTAELVSEREKEVLILLAEGSTNREIAEALFISEGTVKTHVHHLAEKLEAKSRGAIVQRARVLGIL